MMKPFLGIDLTENKKNRQPNGEEFLIAEASSDMAQALETSVENVVNITKKSKFPLGVRIGHWICGALGIVVVIGFLEAMTGEDRVSLTMIYQNASWLFWLAGGCLIAWLILTLLSHQKEKNILESDEYNHIVSRLATLSDDIFAGFAVPSDAQAVDILSFTYKMKNGIPKAIEQGLNVTPYSNLGYRIFTDSENLYLADLERKYSFPLSSLCAIRTVTKRILIPDWNKETEPNEGIYKQYKLSMTSNGCISFKPYYILEIEHNDEKWGIYFPNYELPTFEALTGLTAE